MTLESGYASFNLVIERLLISGELPEPVLKQRVESFNLVIERLLISGRHRTAQHSRLPVSISLSSGFSFQVNY